MKFSLQTKVPASAKRIYNAWLSSEGHSAMTGGEANCSDQVGGRFTAWDGYIEGKNIVLEPHTAIIQSWRTSEFDEDDSDSVVEILLAEEGSETVLTLNHSKVPKHGKQYIKGWEEHYFEPMKAYFSEK